MDYLTASKMTPLSKYTHCKCVLMCVCVVVVAGDSKGARKYIRQIKKKKMMRGSGWDGEKGREKSRGEGGAFLLS